MQEKPKPALGLIIRYDYLWSDEDRTGQLEGSKERPCAVVAASHRLDDGDHIVLLCPISHTEPENATDGIQVPMKVARYIGLDNRKQWIRTNEFNEIRWSDAGIVPARPDQWEYGRMPGALFDQMRGGVQENKRIASLQQVKREV